MPTHFRWITEWTLDAPIAGVWYVLSEPERYPEWWPGIEQVKTVSGNGDVGTITDHVVKAGPGLRLRFRMTTVERRQPEKARLSVSGDSEGFTEWRLQGIGEGRTAVTHAWDVELQRPTLRMVARIPGAGSFFERRHRATMAQGRRNLERILAATAR